MPKDLNAQQTGIQKGNPVNDNTPRPIRGMNSFPDNFRHPDTHRFGDIDPFYVKNVLRHDRLPLRCGHEVRSYTLASPMLSDVVMHKTFVHVPMKAIYPLNWDLMLVPPTQGDDVPDDTRFVVKNLLSFCRGLKNFYTMYDSYTDLTNNLSWEVYFKIWFFLESVFSNGSLFAKMNMHFAPYYISVPDEDGRTYSFDQLFDLNFNYLADNGFLDNMIFNVTYESGLQESIAYSLPDAPDNWQFNGRILSLGAILEIIRNNEFTVAGLNSTALQIPNTNVFSSFDINVPVDESGNNIGFNLEYIAAYHLACAQFMTNEHVDFIYTAELYRKELKSLITSSMADSPNVIIWPSFEYNGDRFEYDVFSGHVFDSMFSAISDADSVSLFLNYLPILNALRINFFSARKSLKYGDYFTGSRPQPLAVGEVTVPLVDGSVDVLNTSRGISITRFRNTVNLVGRKVGNYLKGLWGGSLPQAPDDVPTFLASEAFGIGKQEVENTGAEQASATAENIVTTNLRASNSKYLLTANFDQPAICIGLVYFDCPVIYAKTMTRFAFHYDRYDDFIPQLQYFGDQEIFARELGLPVNGNFAYTIRNMEYKQSYSYASGGFIDFLKSWVMIQDNQLGNPLPVTSKISPEYIRYTNYEFDRFYKSLTGLSLASRFHFIINHRNISTLDRQMAYTPQILQ